MKELPAAVLKAILANPTTRIDGKPVSASDRKRIRERPEADFQRRVIDLAHSFGYVVAHFRSVPIARADGTIRYAAPVEADGEGFPDLIIVGNGRIIAWELKVSSSPTLRQLDWIKRFKKAGAWDAGIYRPKEWDRMVRILSWKEKCW